MGSSNKNVYIFGYDPISLSKGRLKEEKIISDFEIAEYTNHRGNREQHRDEVIYCSSIYLKDKYFVLQSYDSVFNPIDNTIEIHKDDFVRFAGLSHIYYDYLEYHCQISDVHCFFNCKWSDLFENGSVDCLIEQNGNVFYCSKRFLREAYLYFKNNCKVRSSRYILSALTSGKWQCYTKKWLPKLFYTIFNLPGPWLPGTWPSYVVWSSSGGISGVSGSSRNLIKSTPYEFEMGIIKNATSFNILINKDITPNARSPDCPLINNI